MNKSKTKQKSAPKKQPSKASVAKSKQKVTKSKPSLVKSQESPQKVTRSKPSLVKSQETQKSQESLGTVQQEASNKLEPSAGESEGQLNQAVSRAEQSRNSKGCETLTWAKKSVYISLIVLESLILMVFLLLLLFYLGGVAKRNALTPGISADLMVKLSMYIPPTIRYRQPSALLTGEEFDHHNICLFIIMNASIMALVLTCIRHYPMINIALSCIRWGLLIAHCNHQLSQCSWVIRVKSKNDNTKYIFEGRSYVSDLMELAAGAFISLVLVIMIIPLIVLYTIVFVGEDNLRIAGHGSEVVSKRKLKVDSKSPAKITSAQSNRKTKGKETPKRAVPKLQSNPEKIPSKMKSGG